MRRSALQGTSWRWGLWILPRAAAAALRSTQVRVAGKRDCARGCRQLSVGFDYLLSFHFLQESNNNFPVRLSTQNAIAWQIPMPVSWRKDTPDLVNRPQKKNCSVVSCREFSTVSGCWFSEAVWCCHSLSVRSCYSSRSKSAGCFIFFP